LGLRYGGASDIGGVKRLLFEGGNLGKVHEIGSVIQTNQWWIDMETGLVAEIRSSAAWATQPSPGVWRTRYLYDSINRSLPQEAFAVPCPGSVTPRSCLGSHHAASIRDGSDSHIDIAFDNSGIH
jgi:hypothetical protein